jgi:hypothetical protein
MTPLPRRIAVRLARITRLALVAGSVCAVALPSLALAQATPPAAQASPIDDLIARVRSDVNNLAYADAVRRGNEVFAFARSMRLDQMIALRGIMASAFFPDEVAAQKPDSAMKHLVELVKLQPDVTLPVEIRWPGLDSLLEVARSRTFAVQMRPAQEDQLVGTEGRGTVSVIASRPARYRLRLRALPNGTAVLHDSVTTPASEGRLTFRGHDGKTALISAGQYEVILTAVDVASGDSVVLRHSAEATGTAPTMVPMPVFDTTLLKPDMSRPPRVRTALTSIFFATATFMIASSARAEEPLASEFGTDGRGTFVGIAILGAAVGSFWLDKGVVSVENLQSNMAARAAYRKALADAEAENRKRISEYRVTVKISREAR